MKEIILEAVKKGYKPAFYTLYGINANKVHDYNLEPESAEICELALLQEWLRGKDIDVSVIPFSDSIKSGYRIHGNKKLSFNSYNEALKAGILKALEI